MTQDVGGSPSWLRRIVRRLLPLSVRRSLVRATRWPPVGTVDFGDLRRVTPISRSWGGDRGLPVDRYYIEQFLAAWSADIHGRVLEIGDNVYTLRFGGDRVEHSEILYATPGNPKATYVDDLATGLSLPEATFDCVVCTQTLQFISDLGGAVRTLYRILKPGGVLLATLPGISQICKEEMDLWGDCWRFTDRSVTWLLEHSFGSDGFHVEARGNVLAAVAFLSGVAAQELTPEELETRDPAYQVSLGVRAVRG